MATGIKCMNACNMLGRGCTPPAEAWTCENSVFSLYKLTCASYIWDLRTEVLVFLCLIFLESLKERPAPAFSLGVAPSRPSSQAMGNQCQSIQTEMSQDYSSSFKKKRKKKTPSLSFCAIANIATFLAGRGSYFVYVWTRILIDRVSCNPILNYRFSSRLMQQIVSK